MSNLKDQRKNRIVLKRNPNSPEAIQARLDGVEDPTNLEKHYLIGDPDAARIEVDLTSATSNQDIGYTILSGSKLSRQLLRYSLGYKGNQRTITCYYKDANTNQWIIITDFYDRAVRERIPVVNPQFPVGNIYDCYGIYSGIPGENWRNEGRDADAIVEARDRVYNRPQIDPKKDITPARPERDADDDDLYGITP